MSGPGDPPDGTPEGVPGGGDEEYRSVVFDESFVRAARIQEFSARERLDGATRAVRVRHAVPGGLARQAVALVLLIVLAFGFAIYMGVRHPYHSGTSQSTPPLRATVIPLVPSGAVRAVPAAAPFDGSPAAHFGVGSDGLQLPAVHGVGSYAESEVMQAYRTAQQYLTLSGVDTRAVTGGDVGEVLNLLAPAQQDQFQASLTHPADDGAHEATGWLVRFDPAAKVRLVGQGVRVHGVFDDAVVGSDNALQISADHTFVYALRGPGAPDTPVSLFTVRRQLVFRFSHNDLEQHQIELVRADVAAGPLSCGAPVDGYFRPILAGGRATGTVGGVDPYDRDHPVGAVCAPLAGAGAASVPPVPTSTGSPARAPGRAPATPLTAPRTPGGRSSAPTL